MSQDASNSIPQSTTEGQRRDASTKRPVDLSWRKMLLAIAVFALTWLVYIPALHAGFILDDDRLVTGNPLIGDPNGWWKFWCTTITPDYLPVMSDTFWAEWRLWGMNPFGYHVTNVLLHCLDTVLVGLVLSKLRMRGAWFAALLFGVHPVNVRSVAWISELKNTLSMAFYLSSIWAYAHYDQTRARKFSLLAIVLFGLGLLSKSSVVVLPAVLLLLVWYRRGELKRADWRNVLPFFLMSAAAAVTTIWYQYNRSIDPNMPVRDPSAWRLASAGDSFWFYLVKLVDPTHLAMIYPRWHIATSSPLSYAPTVLALICLAGLYALRNTVARPVFVTFAYFLIALSPVLGFVNMAFYYSSMVSDHLQYIAMIGPCALAAAGVATAYGKLGGFGRVAIISASSVCIITLMVLSQAQARLYQDRVTLAQDTLKTNPASFWAHGEVGNMAMARGDYYDAEREFRTAIALAPKVMVSYSNMGALCNNEHRYGEALKWLQKADQLKPDQPDVRFNMAAALIGLGDLSGAERILTGIVRMYPGDARAAQELRVINEVLNRQREKSNAHVAIKHATS